MKLQEDVASHGRKVVTIIDPHIKRDPGYYIYQEAEQNHYFVRDKDGKDFDGCDCNPLATFLLHIVLNVCLLSQPQGVGTPPTYTCAALQMVLAWILILPGHAQSRSAVLVGTAVFFVQVQGVHAKPVRLE